MADGALDAWDAVSEWLPQIRMAATTTTVTVESAVFPANSVIVSSFSSSMRLFPGIRNDVRGNLTSGDERRIRRALKDAKLIPVQEAV
jgi:hypothetical protein